MGFKLALILFVVMSTISGGFYFYYKTSQERIATLISNNSKLNIAVATNEQTIKTLQTNLTQVTAQLQDVNNKFQDARIQNNLLAAKLAKHDLGTLAATKPELVNIIINKASKSAGRCFELMSGSPLTLAERNAKNANTFNSQCPWLYYSLAGNSRLQSSSTASSSNIGAH